MPGAAATSQSRLKVVAARYREARQSLKTPSSQQSRRGLDWMNFFLADVQTGFGTFVAFYLARLGWSESSVGLALTIGGLAGVLSQIPGGTLADAVVWKRGLIATGIAMIGVAALVLALAPSYPLVVFPIPGRRSGRRIHRHCRGRSCGSGLDLDICFGNEACRLFGLNGWIRGGRLHARNVSQPQPAIDLQNPTVVIVVL
jgi:hypothetical protein